MKTKMSQQEINVLTSFAKAALTAPYGSEAQVDNETKFYEMCEAYGVDIEDEAAGYCNKATNRECIERMFVVLRVPYDQEQFKQWEEIGYGN